MANKPSIYSTCKAGCLWEVPHKSDFDASASHIEQVINADGKFYFVTGKEYKIFANKDADGNFDCALKFSYLASGVSTDFEIENENKDAFAESFVFRFLSATLSDDATTITLVYEIAGYRYTETITGASLTLATENYIRVDGATRVLLYNADATIKSEPDISLFSYFVPILPSIRGGYPSIDTKNYTVFIPADTCLIDNRLPNGYVSLAEQTIDYKHTSTARIVAYNLETAAVEILEFKSKPAFNKYLIIAVLRVSRDSTTDDSDLTYGVSSTCPWYIDGELFGEADKTAKKNPFIRAVNHRGYNSIAPENTLAAYKLSKLYGFEYVECDIAFTSDGVPVLLHDDSINRTARNADGTALAETINIADITYEQALTYDFGIYKSESFAGEKIPLFEDFIKLCKGLGLKPYLELKGVPTTEQIESVINIVKRYGMLKDVTWISFYFATCEAVISILPTARIGFVTETLSDEKWEFLQTKKAGNIDIFLDISWYTLYYDESGIVENCANADIPIEVWTINYPSDIKAMDSYVSGFTSDYTLANEVLYDEYVK